MEKQNSKLNLSQIFYNTHPIILRWIVTNFLAIMFFFIFSSIFID